MYSAEKASSGPPPDAGKFVRIAIGAIIGIVILALAGNQAVVLSMNVTEFDKIFTQPLYYSIISGIVLAAIALVRVNIVQRSSIFWFFIRTAVNLLNRSPNDQPNQTIPNFRETKVSAPNNSVVSIFTSYEPF